MEKFPDIPQVRTLKRIPEAWTIAQMGVILSACAQQPGTISGVPASLWWPGLVLFIFDTGLRISAALKVAVSDIDLDRSRVHVRAATQKQRTDQIFTLHQQTVQVLGSGLTSPPRKLVFQWDFSIGTLYYRYRAILEKAGLPCGRDDKFHRIRRASATQVELALGRGAATEHLGHSSQRLTEKYVDKTQLPLQDIANKVPRPNLSLDHLPEVPKPNGNGEAPDSLDPSPADNQANEELQSITLLTGEQVAERLGLCQITVGRMVQTGEFPEPIKVHGSLRWPLASLQQWIDSQGEGGKHDQTTTT